MTTDPCRDWRSTLGAAALGGLDPSEEIALRAHLDGCAECRAELRELTAVARALDAAPVANIISAPAEPSHALGERVLERVSRERGEQRDRRTRRVAVGVSALVGVAAVIMAIVLVVSAGSSSGTRIALKGTGGARATATLHAQSVGTAVKVNISGLSPQQYYWLWLTGAKGHRVGAGTFTGSREAVDLELTAALPLSKARRIWVTDEKDHVVLDAMLPVHA